MMRASLPTVTWPNHTTLVTGVEPGKHGVIGNSYFDRVQGKVISLLPDLDDARLAADGDVAESHHARHRRRAGQTRRHRQQLLRSRAGQGHFAAARSR